MKHPCLETKVAFIICLFMEKKKNVNGGTRKGHVVVQTVE